MACSSLPSHDPGNGKIEHGISCAGCQVFVESKDTSSHGYWVLAARDKIYAHRGYLEHFVWCKQAQILWEESEQGTKEPSGLPSFCKKGGFVEKTIYTPRDVEEEDDEDDEEDDEDEYKDDEGHDEDY